MSHYAKVENWIVTDVIVADQEYIDSGAVGDPSLWYKTSYNTRGNQHYSIDADGNYEPDGTTGFRKNYAGIGFTYDPVLDAFIEPQPYPSWVLDTETCTWMPPVPYPDDGNLYVWDEALQEWVLVVE